MNSESESQQPMIAHACIFEKLNSPYKEPAKKDLAEIRTKIGEKEYNRLIEEIKEELEGIQDNSL